MCEGVGLMRGGGCEITFVDCGEKEQDTVCVLCTQHVRSVEVDIAHVPGFDEGHHIILFRLMVFSINTDPKNLYLSTCLVSGLRY